MIKRWVQSACLWICQRLYDLAIRRGDQEEASYWQAQAEKMGGWDEP
jgi:hypothetical protein